MGKNILENPDIVFDLSIPWYDRLEMIKELGDSDLLFEIYRKTPEPEIRTAIVHHTKNQNLLEQISLDDDDNSVRRHAVSKLDGENSDVLIQVIENDNDHTVRIEAVKKLHPGHQLIYYKIMIEDPHNDVRKKAIKKLRLGRLKDTELRELAIRGQEPLVRTGAIFQLENESELKKVALEGEDYQIIERAIDKIENKEYLKEIAEHAEFAHGRYSAIYKLDESDQEFIADLCMNDSNLEVQKTCIEMISSPEILTQLRVKAKPELQNYIKEKLRRYN